MAAIANFTVADATPTNTTLYPLRAGLESSIWVGRSAATVDGNKKLEAKLSLATSRRPTDRVTVLYASPREVLVDANTLVQDIGRFAGEFVIPLTWTETQRNHFAFEVASAITAAVIKNIVKNRDVPYGG